jgi:hypothetical protein
VKLQFFAELCVLLRELCGFAVFDRKSAKDSQRAAMQNYIGFMDHNGKTYILSQPLARLYHPKSQR